MVLRVLQNPPAVSVRGVLNLGSVCLKKGFIELIEFVGFIWLVEFIELIAFIKLIGHVGYRAYRACRASRAYQVYLVCCAPILPAMVFWIRPVFINDIERIGRGWQLYLQQFHAWHALGN